MKNDLSITAGQNEPIKMSVSTRVEHNPLRDCWDGRVEIHLQPDIKKIRSLKIFPCSFQHTLRAGAYNLRTLVSHYKGIRFDEYEKQEIAEQVFSTFLDRYDLNALKDMVAETQKEIEHTKKFSRKKRALKNYAMILAL